MVRCNDGGHPCADTGQQRLGEIRCPFRRKRCKPRRAAVVVGPEGPCCGYGLACASTAALRCLRAQQLHAIEEPCFMPAPYRRALPCASSPPKNATGALRCRPIAPLCGRPTAVRQRCGHCPFLARPSVIMGLSWTQGHSSDQPHSPALQGQGQTPFQPDLMPQPRSLSILEGRYGTGTPCIMVRRPLRHGCRAGSFA